MAEAQADVDVDQQAAAEEVNQAAAEEVNNERARKLLEHHAKRIGDSCAASTPLKGVLQVRGKEGLLSCTKCKNTVATGYSTE